MARSVCKFFTVYNQLDFKFLEILNIPMEGSMIKRIK
jgi:hypothetical protein